MTMDSRSMTPFMAMARGRSQEIWPGIGQIRFHRQRPGQGGAQEQGQLIASEGEDKNNEKGPGDHRNA